MQKCPSEKHEADLEKNQLHDSKIDLTDCKTIIVNIKLQRTLSTSGHDCIFCSIGS